MARKPADARRAGSGARASEGAMPKGAGPEDRSGVIRAVLWPEVASPQPQGHGARSESAGAA